jgi:mRNA interferase MazF
MVDLGLAAKVRPCVVLSVPFQESDRSLVTVIPHTTAVRQSRFEIAVAARFLRPGAFDAQGIVTVPTVRLMIHVRTLTPGWPESDWQKNQVASFVPKNA